MTKPALRRLDPYEAEQLRRAATSLALALVELRADDAWVRHATACRTCGAASGEPCMRPNGRPYLDLVGSARIHAPRGAAYSATLRGAPARSWISDLAVDHVDPRRVLTAMRASALYALGVAAGRIDDHPRPEAPRTRPLFAVRRSRYRALIARLVRS